MQHFCDLLDGRCYINGVGLDRIQEVCELASNLLLFDSSDQAPAQQPASKRSSLQQCSGSAFCIEMEFITLCLAWIFGRKLELQNKESWKFKKKSKRQDRCAVISPGLWLTLG